MSWIKLADREDAKDRTKIRAMFRATAHVPIIEDERFTEPTLDGKSGGWFTKGGSPIAYPSAYSKKGFGNMVYEGSSLTIRIPKGFKVR
jgi:hypothetical protein